VNVALIVVSPLMVIAVFDMLWFLKISLNSD